MLLIVFLYAIFAATFSLGKIMLNYGPPIYLVGLRMFIAGLLLLFYQYFFTNQRLKFHWDHIGLYVQVVMFSIYIPYILRFWGLIYMPSYKASLLYNLGPFISYLLGYCFYKEKVTWHKVIGLIIGFCGLLPTLMASAPTEEAAGGIAFMSWPELSIIASVSSLAYGWIVLRKLIKDHSYPPALVNGMSMFAGGLLALVTSQLVESRSCIIDSGQFFLILALIILFSNVIGHNLYGWLLRFYTPTFMAFASFLTPIFAALYGWMFLGEAVAWHFYLSTVMVFAGLGIFYHGEMKEKDTKEYNVENLES